MATYNVKTHPTFAGYDRLAENQAVQGLRNVVRKIAKWAAEQRAYNQTFQELSQLSDRDLADIGISRYDIGSIARQTAKTKGAGN